MEEGKGREGEWGKQVRERRKREEKERKKEVGGGEEKREEKEEEGREKSTSNFLPSCWLLSDMNEQAALQVDTIQVY